MPGSPHPQLKEADIQRLILHFLKARRIFAWRNNSTGIYDESRGVYRRNQGVGYIKGVADILGILPDGKFLAIEVKSSRGRLSEEQRAFLEEVHRRGGVALKACCLEDVQTALRGYL